MRLLAALICAALAGCGACRDGVPENFAPQIMTGADGKSYFVSRYMGCNFTVVEVRK